MKTFEIPLGTFEKPSLPIIGQAYNLHKLLEPDTPPVSYAPDALPSSHLFNIISRTPEASPAIPEAAWPIQASLGELFIATGSPTSFLLAVVSIWTDPRAALNSADIHLVPILYGPATSDPSQVIQATTIRNLLQGLLCTAFFGPALGSDPRADEDPQWRLWRSRCCRQGMLLDLVSGDKSLCLPPSLARRLARAHQSLKEEPNQHTSFIRNQSRAHNQQLRLKALATVN